MPNSLSVSKHDFIEGIRQAIYSGSGITPLVGSGASAASGIIMGIEFSDYLAYVVRKVLDPSNAWDLRRNGWPPYPKSEDYQDTQKWTRQQFERICRENGYTVDFAGGCITSIRAVRDGNPDHSLSKALNCPSPPCNIRSPFFRPHDSSLTQLTSALRADRKATSHYEPLWSKPEQSKTSSDWVLEIGLRSLSDWRATLHFLSRIEKQESARVTLSRPDGSVIDRFNTFITTDKQPNLTHKMLAALARPLRMRTVLTTNFDTLSEEAFSHSGHVLTKFFVSKKGRLPDPFLVRAQPSIIKLHGELLETRADFSLDDDPAVSDKRRFCSYFVDTFSGTERFRSMLSHLLVLGFSASDMRIIRMIHSLLDETSHFCASNRPKVFWICVSDSDRQRVDSLFHQYQGRVVTLQTARPDLLLLELYQLLTRALPGAGQTYEYNHNVPPSRTEQSPFDQNLETSLEDIRVGATTAFTHLERGLESDKLLARDALARLAGHTLFQRIEGKQPIPPEITDVDRQFDIIDLEYLTTNKTLGPSAFWAELKKRVRHPYRILFFNTTCGALEALGILHSRLSQKPGVRCLWFELADYINTDSLLRDVLRSIALRSGRFQREHVTIHPLREPISSRSHKTNEMIDVVSQLSAHLESLCEVHRITPGDWPILLYGRDLAGSCVNWESNPWSTNDWMHLPVLIGAFACAGFPIVLAHSCPGRLQGESEKLRKAQTLAENMKSSSGASLPPIESREQKRYLSQTKRDAAYNLLPAFANMREMKDERLSVFEGMCSRVFERCQREPAFRHFVYAACLFRQSRRPSALFYEAVQQCRARFNLRGVDNDILRSEDAARWVKELERERVFYGKAGGTSWMHRDIRIALKSQLDTLPYLDGSTVRAHCHESARIHFWIGDWYEKAFYATGFAKPVLESLHHRYQAASLACYSIPRGLTMIEHSDEIRQHRFLLMRASLNELSKTLLVARQYLKLWLANAHGFPMFETINGAPFVDLQFPAGLRRREREELTKACDLARAILDDTQQSIRNEADIKISSQVVAQPSSFIQPTDQVIHLALNHLLSCIYGIDKDWKAAIPSLHKAINSIYGIPIATLETCVPLGSVDPQVVPSKCAGAKGGTITLGEYARAKGEAIGHLDADCRRLPELLVVIEVAAYSQLRRAKFCGHSVDSVSTSRLVSMDNVDDSWRNTDVRKEWLRVTRLCNLGIDWCKHLSPNAMRLDAELRIRMHSYYAVALANLDRFNEAHRHLNEAWGIQSKHECASPKIEQAKLGLRRAEVILTEAHRVAQVLRILTSMKGARRAGANGREHVVAMVERVLECGIALQSGQRVTSPEKDLYLTVQAHPSVISCVNANPDEPDVVVMSLKRLLVSMLDDAWFAIESSERVLSGQSQSSLWWGRIFLMKMRACGYQIHAWSEGGSKRRNGDGERCSDLRMLAYRHRRINPQAIWHLFETSSLNNYGNEYRQARLIRYVATCLQVFSFCDDEPEFIRTKCIELHDKYLEGRFHNLTLEMQSVVNAAEREVGRAMKACGVKAR